MKAFHQVTTSLVMAIVLAMATAAHAQPGSVVSHQKINDTQGGLSAQLHDGDAFGRSSALLGDLNGDGAPEMAIGAALDDDGGRDRGAVWIVSLNPSGAFNSELKISNTVGGFDGVLHDGDAFGSAVASPGDLDGDGVNDLAVGAIGDDDGGADRGAVWILFMNADGTVKSHQKISALDGDFFGALDDGDQFGASLAALGDLDGDGVVDLAVGADRADDGGVDRGAVWILFMSASGTVKSNQKIAHMQSGFTGELLDGDYFGASLAALGDFDGDGVSDLGVAPGDDDGGVDRGAGWILFLNADGTVKSHRALDDNDILADGDAAGSSAAAIGDLDGDGVGDLAVGVVGNDQGGADRGGVWILFLERDGSIKAYQMISNTLGGFDAPLDDGDQFGASVAAPGDLDGDGAVDLLVGVTGDDDSGPDRGAVWVLLLNPDGTVKSQRRPGDLELHNGDRFGHAAASIGDLDGDGVEDLAVAGWADDDGGQSRGAVWLLLLRPDGSVRAHHKISDTEGGFTGALDDGDLFGSSVGALGDLDGDGVVDIAVGAGGDDDAGSQQGAIWILFLNANGTVKSHTKIIEFHSPNMTMPGDLNGDGVNDLAIGSSRDSYGPGDNRGAIIFLFMNADGTVQSSQKINQVEGGFDGVLDDDDRFGTALAAIGDLDGDGVGDLAVTAVGDDDGGEDRGALWVLFLKSDNTVKAHQKISSTEGGFTGFYGTSYDFGRSICAIGDLNGDANNELVVGAPNARNGKGAVYVLLLNDDGTVHAHQTISDTEGGFDGHLDLSDNFGRSVASLADLDGDGIDELAVGAEIDSDDGQSRGAMWMLFLDSACRADTNSDGVVGPADLSIILGNWGPVPPGDAIADLTGDSVVNAADLAIVLGNWGPCP